MKYSIKIISTILIIIFASTVVLSLTTNLWFGNKMNQQKEKRAVNNWPTYQSDLFHFTFRYPPQALVDISDPALEGEPKRVRVRLIGPESEPNTEITDGFTFYVRSVVQDNQESFSEAANQIFLIETERREVIKPLQQSKVGDQNAFSFGIRSELGGEVIYEIIKGEQNTVFITTSVVSSPQNVNRDYRTIIEEMQSSLALVHPK